MKLSDDLDYDSVVETYLRAKAVVIQCGYASEVDWQYARSLDSMTEVTFLGELAWVVLAAGLSDRVVRKVYPLIADAFCGWSIYGIGRKGLHIARAEAYSHFSHDGKIDAICDGIREVTRDFDAVVAGIRANPVTYVRRFAYIGPVTAYHLAKNLGADVCKPDRHMVRLSAALGFQSVEDLCGVIAERTAERISVVDIVLWRFLTLCRKYELAR